MVIWKCMFPRAMSLFFRFAKRVPGPKTNNFEKSKTYLQEWSKSSGNPRGTEFSHSWNQKSHDFWKKRFRNDMFIGKVGEPSRNPIQKGKSFSIILRKPGKTQHFYEKNDDLRMVQNKSYDVMLWIHAILKA